MSIIRIKHISRSIMTNLFLHFVKYLVFIRENFGSLISPYRAKGVQHFQNASLRYGIYFRGLNTFIYQKPPEKSSPNKPPLHTKNIYPAYHCDRDDRRRRKRRREAEGEREAWPRWRRRRPAGRRPIGDLLRPRRLIRYRRRTSPSKMTARRRSKMREKGFVFSVIEEERLGLTSLFSLS